MRNASMRFTLSRLRQLSVTFLELLSQYSHLLLQAMHTGAQKHYLFVFTERFRQQLHLLIRHYLGLLGVALVPVMLRVKTRLGPDARRTVFIFFS
jgi:hypothetical protein